MGDPPAHPRSAPDEHGDGEVRAKVVELELDGLQLAVVELPPSNVAPDLTPAEQEIVRLVIDGLSNREIAAIRNVSVKTIANQLRDLYRKLGVTSRFELASHFGA